MIFPRERYDRIEELVTKYQSGDKESSGEELITLFTPLFNKYIKIIKRGTIDFNDYESRFFVSLFIPDPKTRQNLRRHYQSKKTRETAYKTLSLICNACTQTFDEDLYQDLVLAFLKYVNRYQVETNFCAYLASSFPFEVAQIVRKILYNPISTAFISDFSEEDMDLFVSKPEENEEDMDNSLPSNGNEELSNSWVYGLTCGDVFAVLSPSERLILKMFYLDEISDTDIGRKFGYHRNSIGSKRRAAVEKVRQKTIELRMLKEERHED